METSDLTTAADSTGLKRATPREPLNHGANRRFRVTERRRSRTDRAVGYTTALVFEDQADSVWLLRLGGLRATLCASQVAVEQFRGLALVARHQVPVAVERDRDRRVPHVRA